MFAGQVDDPFFVDLGSVFDLAGLRPFNTLHVLPLPAAAGVDGVGGFNTHAIAIQIPIDQLTRDGRLPTGPTDPDAVLGIYASASRPTLWVKDDDDDHDRDRRCDDRDDDDKFVQVSRLGNPLINEVVIPLGQKDRWNMSDPRDDEQLRRQIHGARGHAARERPVPGARRRARRPAAAIWSPCCSRASRAELHGQQKGRPASPEHRHSAERRRPARETVSACWPATLAGFPNGRRLEDDVTDIDLRAFACGYGPVVGPAHRVVRFLRRQREPHAE